jgi:predicted transposase YbfD/YdcC
MRSFPPYTVRERKAERQSHTDYNKGHGRREKRTIETTTALNEIIAKLGWSSVRQVFRITRERTTKDRESGEQKKTTEVVYGITDLTREQANAERLLEYNRAHWGIENKSHYVRDVTFSEDAHRARTAFGPIIMSSVRNTAITICRLYKYLNIAEARRDFAWDNSLILNMLGIVNK